jgi:hypothetical protein
MNVMNNTILYALNELQTLEVPNNEKSTFEQMISDMYIKAKINHYNTKFGSKRPHRSDTKSILFAQSKDGKTDFYILRKDICPLFSHPDSLSSLEKLEKFISFESMIEEQMEYWSDFISNQRKSLYKELNHIINELNKEIGSYIFSFYGKPSNWWFGDDGKETIEFRYSGNYLHQIYIDLTNKYFLTNEEATEIKHTVTAKYKEKLEEIERKIRMEKYNKFHRLFSDLDSQHRFQFGDLPNGVMYDFEKKVISHNFNFSEQSLVHEFKSKYLAVIDHIYHLETASIIDDFPTKNIFLSKRYFFTLDESAESEKGTFHIYSCKGDRNKRFYHVFQNGLKIKKTSSRKKALQLIGK